MNKNSRIYVAGHRGLVGSAIVRALERGGFTNLIFQTRDELDLANQREVNRFFEDKKPEYVFLAAARVGGILANNTHPAEFLRDNLIIQTNVIDAAFRQEVRKLLFLGSSCIYPKHSDQPIREEALLTGALEPTNEWYAIAKISGLKMCQAYRRQYGFNAISVMPTNLYGPGDNFSSTSSHVVPALIRRFDEAVQTHSNEVEIWGTGAPLREFLFVDDLADACLFLMHCYNDEMWINVGTGTDVSIAYLAKLVAEAVGYDGSFRFDATKPDGTPRKLLDITRVRNLGWKQKVNLRDGIKMTVEWFRDHRLNYRQ
jgi:GDP-L-fucose synthase